LITLNKDTHTFDAENFALSIPVGDKQVQVAVFDKVTVEIDVETDKNTLRGKVVMKLVEPVRSDGL
jgi:exosome complex exonuclease DIS3/RRP44